MKCRLWIGLCAVAGSLAPGLASATNGYLSHGYGVKAQQANNTINKDTVE